MDPEDLQDTVDHVAIGRLHSAYADVVSRRAWAELDDLFLPDAPVRVDPVTRPAIHLVGPQALGAFIGEAIEGFEFFQFVVLNARIALRVGGDPDAAGARMYMSELRQGAASGHWTTVYGVYHDRYRRIDGRWWFAERHYQSLARTGRGDVFPFPHDERID